MQPFTVSAQIQQQRELKIQAISSFLKKQEFCLHLVLRHVFIFSFCSPRLYSGLIKKLELHIPKGCSLNQHYSAGALLTFRWENSSRLAPCCWPSYPLNPVRKPRGSRLHSHSLDTPCQPWHPASATPFDEKENKGLCVCGVFSVFLHDSEYSQSMVFKTTCSNPKKRRENPGSLRYCLNPMSFPTFVYHQLQHNSHRIHVSYFCFSCALIVFLCQFLANSVSLLCFDFTPITCPL